MNRDGCPCFCLCSSVSYLWLTRLFAFQTRYAWPDRFSSRSKYGFTLSIMATNVSSVSDCAPSLKASSGFGCTSTIIPSAPAAIPAFTMGGISERRPVPWLGSTMIGKWLNSANAGIAAKSSVFLV